MSTLIPNPKLSSKDKTTKYKRKYFLPHARLNRGQRKYCHCLMKARPTAKNAYAVCQSMRARVGRQAKTKKARRQLTFNPYSTNCVMSYDFNDYTLKEVQALAKEKGITTTYITKPTIKNNKKYRNKRNTMKDNKTNTKIKNKRKEYSKDKLVEKLTQYYILGKNKASQIRKHSKQIKTSKMS